MMVDPLLHHAVTALLVYLLIGSLIWAFLYTRGTIEATYAAHLRRGGAVSALAMVLWTVFIIIEWPIFLRDLIWELRR